MARSLAPAAAALLLACIATVEARAQPCTDATPPELAITSPARAATLEQGGTGDDVVVVSGVAEDVDSPLVSLVVAGQELLAAPANGAVPFAVPTTSRWGLTIVTASAQDACGNRTERAQSFLRSGAYFPAAPAGPGEATVGGALALRAGQQLIDDHDRADLDDLTSLADAAIAEVDWNQTLPQVLASDPLRSGCACSCTNPGGCLGACCPWHLVCPTWADVGYTVSRGTVSTSGLDLAYLQSSGAGVESRVEVDTLALPLTGSARLASCVAGAGPLIVPASVSGTVTGSGLYATGTVVPSTSGGMLQTSVENSVLGFDELEASLACGTWEFLCDARDTILNAVLDLLEDRIADVLADVLESQLAPLFNDFLDELRLDPTLVLPPPLSVTIDADSGFDFADTSPSGVDLVLAARLQPRERGTSIPPDARGAIRRDGAPPADPADGRALGVALKDDLVNQLFWATWTGGGLDLPDLRAEALAAGYEVESLSLQAHLPPVGRSGDVPDQAEIGFGDAFVELTVDLGQLLGGAASGPLDVDFWFSAFLDGRFAVSPPERLRFEVEGVRAESEIVATNDPLMAELLRPLLDELLAAVAQRLLDDALGELRIPSIDLAATFPGAGVEPGSVLGLAGNAAADRPNDDYTRAAGDVAVSVPAPEPGPLASALAAAAALAAARAARRHRLG